jgi:hypothetical protein
MLQIADRSAAEAALLPCKTQPPESLIGASLVSVAVIVIEQEEKARVPRRGMPYFVDRVSSIYSHSRAAAFNLRNSSDLSKQRCISSVLNVAVSFAEWRTLLNLLRSIFHPPFRCRRSTEAINVRPQRRARQRTAGDARQSHR